MRALANGQTFGNSDPIIVGQVLAEWPEPEPPEKHVMIQPVQETRPLQ